MRTWFLAISLSFLTACSSAPVAANPYVACGSAGPDTFYFPAGTFAPQVPPPRPGYRFQKSDYDPDPETREWYSQVMDYLELPSLTCEAPTAEEAGNFVKEGANEMIVVSAGKDGAQWIIEGRTDRYHVIDRWSEDYDIIAVGRIFIELAQLVITEEDIY